MEKIGATFIGQVYRVISKKDGSGRLEIDFGADAIEDIQMIQRIALKENINFQFAIVPLRQTVLGSQYGDSDYTVSETGEINLGEE